MLDRTPAHAARRKLKKPTTSCRAFCWLPALIVTIAALQLLRASGTLGGDLSSLWGSRDPEALPLVLAPDALVSIPQASGTESVLRPPPRIPQPPQQQPLYATISAEALREATAASAAPPSVAAPKTATKPASPPPPNVLFILADDLRPQLGSYGHRAHTPHLKKLASEGVTFESCFAQITVCNPSRASILSGRRPDTTEIYGFEATTPDGWTTLPAFFRRAGYTTFGVGKIFHWGPGPLDCWTGDVATWPSASSTPSTPTTKAAGLPDNDMPWEVPGGGADSQWYAEEARLPRPPLNAANRFPVAGFWPDSDVFQRMKVLEQTCLLSTVHPESGEEVNGTSLPTEEPPRVSEDSHKPLRSDRTTMPFRDGVFASRAVRLMKVADAQAGKPWFLAVGFSLPHEPIRFPKPYWDIYDDGASSSGASGASGASGFKLPVEAAPFPFRPKGSPIFAYGEIKDKFVYYDGGSGAQRRIGLRSHYGPSKGRTAPEGAVMMTTSTNSWAGLSKEERAKRRTAYVVGANYPRRRGEGLDQFMRCTR